MASRTHIQPAYNCPDCGKDFTGAQSSARTKHLATHRKVLFWKCPFCHRVESSHRYSDLADHMTAVHGDLRDADPILLPAPDEPEKKRRRSSPSPRRSPRSKSGKTTSSSRSRVGSSSRGRSSRSARSSGSSRQHSSSSYHYHHHSPARRRERTPVSSSGHSAPPSASATRASELEEGLNRLQRSPALSQSPPPTGTRLPAEVKQHQRKGTPQRRLTAAQGQEMEEEPRLSTSQEDQDQEEDPQQDTQVNPEPQQEAHPPNTPGPGAARGPAR